MYNIFLMIIEYEDETLARKMVHTIVFTVPSYFIRLRSGRTSSKFLFIINMQLGKVGNHINFKLLKDLQHSGGLVFSFL